jgi:hypothetical protein
MALVVAALLAAAGFAREIEVRAAQPGAATQPESAVRPKPAAHRAPFDDVAQALLSREPDLGRAADLALYGQFVRAPPTASTRPCGRRCA